MERWIREASGRGLVPGAEPVAPAAPAATVVLLRDASGGLETLLAQRSARLDFHGGAWVFPGGRIDPADYGGDPADEPAAARRAAAREAYEEARVRVSPDALLHLGRWTTPEAAPKRFATWFFVAAAGDDVAVADGGETTALRWFTPEDALEARDAGEIVLAPPQYVTLLALDPYRRVAEALEGLAREPSLDVTPRFARLEGGGAACVYDDDVAYADLDLARAGRRHRLLMLPDGRWEYLRDR